MCKIWLLLSNTQKTFRYREILIEVLEKRFGENFKIVNIEDLIFIISNENGLQVKDKDGNILELPKIIFHRLKTNQLDIHKKNLALHYLKVAGCYVLNPIIGTEDAENKFIHLAKLTKNGLSVPKTIFSPNITFKNMIDYREIPDECIIKKINSSVKKYVFFISSKEFLKNISGSLDHQDLYLFQEYIKNSRGKSLRVDVVNNEVISTCMFVTSAETLQSNIFLGGEWRDITGQFPEAEKFALKAAQSIGLDIAGVDFLFKEERDFVICEINSYPGRSRYEDDSPNYKIAEKIADMLEEKLNSIDL